MSSYLNTLQYAELNEVSQRTVQRWAAEGLIFATKINGVYYIDSDEEAPNARFSAGIDSSNVETVPTSTNPAAAGLPMDERPGQDYSPEPEEEPEEEEEEDECHDPGEYPTRSLRRPYGFATRDEAIDYAEPIPYPVTIFRRCSDGRFQVVVNDNA